MSNEIKVIGFLGVDKYDMIHYISRILKNLSYKVLLVDYSESKALKNSIPIPSGLDSSTNIVEYRSVDFSNELKPDADTINRYNYILIDFGFQTSHYELKNCTDIVFVTDLQQHNANRLLNFKIPIIHKYLIIREVIKSKITADYVTQLLEPLKVIKGNHYIISQDTIDSRIMIECQYNNKFKFNRISNPFKDLLFDFISLITAETNTEKEIKKAYKKAERGI